MKSYYTLFFNFCFLFTLLKFGFLYESSAFNARKILKSVAAESERAPASDSSLENSTEPNGESNAPLQTRISAPPVKTSIGSQNSNDIFKSRFGSGDLDPSVFDSIGNIEIDMQNLEAPQDNPNTNCLLSEGCVNDVLKEAAVSFDGMKADAIINNTGGFSCITETTASGSQRCVGADGKIAWGAEDDKESQNCQWRTAGPADTQFVDSKTEVCERNGIIVKTRKAQTEHQQETLGEKNKGCILDPATGEEICEDSSTEPGPEAASARTLVADGVVDCGRTDLSSSEVQGCERATQEFELACQNEETETLKQCKTKGNLSLTDDTKVKGATTCDILNNTEKEEIAIYNSVQSLCTEAAQNCSIMCDVSAPHTLSDGSTYRLNNQAFINSIQQTSDSCSNAQIQTTTEINERSLAINNLIKENRVTLGCDTPTAFGQAAPNAKDSPSTLDYLQAATGIAAQAAPLFNKTSPQGFQGVGGPQSTEAFNPEFATNSQQYVGGGDLDFDEDEFSPNYNFADDLAPPDGDIPRVEGDDGGLTENTKIAHSPSGAAGFGTGGGASSGGGGGSAGSIGGGGSSGTSAPLARRPRGAYQQPKAKNLLALGKAPKGGGSNTGLPSRKRTQRSGAFASAQNRALATKSARSFNANKYLSNKSFDEKYQAALQKMGANMNEARTRATGRSLQKDKVGGISENIFYIMNSSYSMTPELRNPSL